MACELEVETDRHNSRFYELKDGNVNAFAQIVASYQGARSVALYVGSMHKSQEDNREFKLNATQFRRMINLRTMCIELNGIASLEVSAPFYFPLRELCLTDVDISYYDFAMLVRSSSHSLRHLCWNNLRVIGAKNSSAFISELRRIQNLKSLRVDLPLTDIYQSLTDSLPNRLKTIFVSSVTVDSFISKANFDLAKIVFTDTVVYKNNVYDSTTVDKLESEQEASQKTLRANVLRTKLIVGLPQCWTKRAEECQVEPIARFGHLGVFRLIDDDSTDSSKKSVFRLRI